jgi:hypothetical protein
MVLKNQRRVRFFVSASALASLLMSHSPARADSYQTPITIDLVSRADASTAASAFKNQGGTLKLDYVTSSESDQTETIEKKSVNGPTQIDLSTQVEQKQANLDGIEILDSNSKSLAKFSASDIKNWIQTSKFGVNIVVIMTDHSQADAEVRVGKITTMPDDGTPDQNYVAISSIFKNPDDILHAQDIAGTLDQLREISSSTDAYHQDLLSIVSKAKSIDMAHLNLLVDASYLTFADEQKMSQDMQALEAKQDQSFYAEIQKIYNNRYLAERLGSYTNQIIAAGISKASDLNSENGIALLKKMFELGGAGSEAFDPVLKITSLTTDDQRIAFANLAHSKGAFNIAGNIGLDLFKESDHSYDSLLGLTQKFSGASADVIILGALDILPSLTSAQLKQLASATYYSMSKVVAKGMPLVHPLAASDVVSLANLTSGSAKDDIISQGLGLLGHVSTADLMSLSNASYNGSSSILKNSLSTVSDLNPSNVVLIANSMSNSDRDAYLSSALGHFDKLSVSDLRLIASDGSYNEADLLKQGVSKLPAVSIQDLNTLLNVNGNLQAAEALEKKMPQTSASDVSAIASHLNNGDKDSFISFYIGSQKSISTQDFITLANSAGYSMGDILKNSLSKLSDVSPANIDLIASRLPANDCDNYLLAGLDKMSSIKPQELIQMMNTSSYARSSLADKAISKLPALSVSDVNSILSVSGASAGRAEALESKISSVSAAEAVSIASNLNNQDKDAFIQNYIGSRKSLSTSEYITLADGSAYASGAILSSSQGKDNDLSVANVVLIANRLSNQDKDLFIQNYVNSRQSFTTAELLSLANNSAYASGAILSGSISKDSDLTVANAISIANQLSSQDKDKYLLAALGSLKGLSSANLVSLSNAAAYQSNQILIEGGKRLGKS